MDRSRSLSRPPPYMPTPLKQQPPSLQQQQQQHRRAASGGYISHHPFTPNQSPHISTAAATPPPSSSRRDSSPDLVSASFLEPRIAVVLKIPKPWRPWLFFSRLLSICPAIFWGARPALQLLVRAILALPLKTVLEAVAGYGAHGPVLTAPAESTCPAGGSAEAPGRGGRGSLEDVLGSAPMLGSRPLYPWTEMSLGVIWCSVSAYLSFFFADCLMSRWLINYSPQAAIIRLLTINCANAFLTERILYLVGGFDDSRLLLPGWISIATTLTVCYHITQRKINIQKETSTSINIFSIASYLSMVALLAHLHADRTDYPVPPIYRIAILCWQQWQHLTNNSQDVDASHTIKCEL